MPLLVLHYHEMWLKGGNRRFFLRKFDDSIRVHLSGLGSVNVEQEDGRVLVAMESERALAEAVNRVKRIFGVAYFSVAAETGRDLPTVGRAAWEQLAPQSFHTFAVRARRADKTLPFRSQDAERQIGRAVLDQAAAAGRDISVNLGKPDLTCFVEFTRHRALIYSRKIPGPGGMAAGTAGKLYCLLSGGYDSAVAAYKMMRRGARISFVHFYGVAAQAGEASEPVAREIVRVLTAYQGASRLYLVPFHELQREVLLGAPESCRILIYRRLMLRIGEALARRRRALGLVTGDSLAQVASQTLQNMDAVGAVARLPIYRPLAGDDKQEILDLARRIGTYEISSERFSECCPAFMPRHPMLFATREELDRAEEKLQIASLVGQGVAAAQAEIYQLVEGRVVQAERKQHAESSAGALVERGAL